MSDPVTIVTLIIAAIPPTIASLLAAVMTVMVFRKSEVMSKVVKKTHLLVNGAMLIQLRLHAKTSREKAAITSSPIDIATADLAEKLLYDHQVKQALADESEVEG